MTHFLEIDLHGRCNDYSRSAQYHATTFLSSLMKKSDEVRSSLFLKKTFFKNLISWLAS